MDEKRPNKSSSVWVIVIVLLLLGSGPLYVLSTGPAVWLMARGALRREQLVTIYAPLVWLQMRSSTFNDALESYMGLWVPPPQPPATPESS